MAVIARASIAVRKERSVDSTAVYYLLQSSTLSPPAKPTTLPPGGNWVLQEPSYTSGSTVTLYRVEVTIYSDDTFDYSEVSQSSSYEAAKEAYNKAADTADRVTAVEENVTEVETRFGELEHVMEYDYLKTAQLGLRWYDAEEAEEAGYTDGAGYYDASGTYHESASAKIQADAVRIVESYEYVNEETLTTKIDGVTDEIAKTRELINGQIRRGVIDLGNGNRVFGIAVSSQNIFSGSTYIKTDGDDAGEYHVISDSGQCFGLYTATGWEFWRGHVKLGYFDNNSGELHVEQAIIEETIAQGPWRYLQDDNFFGIKYVG